ncbi:MAG: hypothetical protein A2821_02740 [Candidatus Magasanikbacteria bacterium RIFCSPHIGHO2_01_FULL_41_23]|uniref:PDZ domain-containing protein n=1 Tax=Candidatus Magasanikbacteria bacterium RIFCSPLOWO2_01_FULL_40_15 TaxID=1798686 RepID=A0A1F6N1R9_9BACT|nr:MAG: hypothetical protein A2821_02740 [Candidatus Magasanikbacteria bacterium RIFCSPHIGHO2_01_FULL_41_23]OGH67257.1 MAG: hypothetical protein A3C66_00760 [Candidatus Magasanikbacteria bacterium RIFCSPHIGHO2_02_FULL_41_35]OGH74802.1 MAG: hypothetical protein A3F22_04810 [Candidatus Magasanikbacteria bacterium RIFCSPHIGHO2_12_FULL_41_16]OGH77824.1 MAG: hypothetical protein A2983_00310 [Candidatus Magasanikbacteria bacterium RIFCSPLOWO2_01_FULL_40_15]
MSAFAPHLPPPSCLVETHTRWIRTKLFIITVIVALLTGMVGALLIVDAWYPVGLSNSTILISNRITPTPTLDTTIVRDWRSRVIELFDETKIQQEKYYTDAARVTRVVVVNNGGWSIGPLVNLSSKAHLIGVDYQGHRLPVEKIITDEARNLLFVKFSGADFRGNNVFASRSVLQSGRELWGLSNDWQRFTVGQKINNPSAELSASLDTAIFSINDSGATNRILITDQGELVGFTANSQAIIPAWMVEYILPRLLSSDAMLSLPFEWRGSFVESVKMETENKVASGFLVNEVVHRTGLGAKIEHPIKKGDVILKIQNQTVTRDNLAELILSAPNEFGVTVMRGEKLLDLNIKK